MNYICTINDPLYVKWMVQVQDGQLGGSGLRTISFILRGRIGVSQGSGLWKNLMKEMHDTPWAGH